MPPKRAAPSQGPSKLAKQHNLTAEEEKEIKEVWSLFEEPIKGEKNGVMPINDVKSALIALGFLPPPRKSSSSTESPSDELKRIIDTLDPENCGFATYEPFFAICALKIHARDDEWSDAALEARVDEAYRLFTNGQEGPITVAHLLAAAACLKMEVDVDKLEDMINEANDGAGVAVGVNKHQFYTVMKEAGAWK